MITVNSLSGGRTSSYLAVHYPADVEIFALVCIDCHNAGMRKIDPEIRRMVNEKFQKFCPDQPEFRSTAEDPITLKTMFDLEQMLGREIVWVRGKDWTDIVNGMSALPNKQKRFCTEIMKIDPIFTYLFRNHTLPCRMRIGYRADEDKRADTFRETYFMATHCEIGKGTSRKTYSNVYKDYITGHTPVFRTRWAEVPFRIGEFPLIEDGITQFDVRKFWADKPIQFPADSNCQFCFWKNPAQLRENFDTNPEIMAFALCTEEIRDHTILPNISMLNIKNLGKQQTLFPTMKGGGCHGGYCIS